MVSSTETRGSVLVVEDDATVAEVVARYLELDGFDVVCVGNGQAALRAVAEVAPDIVVLDIMLPGIDGLEICRRLRGTSAIPIIMLTALGHESDRIVGLELGADDYLTKPFSPRELVARVNAIMRRSQTSVSASGSHIVTAGDLEVDMGAHEVRRNGSRVNLTAKEFDLLAFLASHPRRVFSRDELLEQVWGYTYGDRSTVTVHVRRLREKIEADPTRPQHVATVWGVGYRFDP
ncbi:MAG: response regulator transcription factor [Actinomycetota bacterium]|nr:response regulator transcription factor [Actinomycetota bacterium]